jgi:uncharacterized protein YmfQ (DUF2313 family)
VIKNGEALEGVAMGLGMTPKAVSQRVRAILKKMNKSTCLNEYYTDIVGKVRKRYL